MGGRPSNKNPLCSQLVPPPPGLTGSPPATSPLSVKPIPPPPLTETSPPPVPLHGKAGPFAPHPPLHGTPRRSPPLPPLPGMLRSVPTAGSGLGSKSGQPGPGVKVTPGAATARRGAAPPAAPPAPPGPPGAGTAPRSQPSPPPPRLPRPAATGDEAARPRRRPQIPGRVASNRAAAPTPALPRGKVTFPGGTTGLGRGCRALRAPAHRRPHAGLGCL